MTNEKEFRDSLRAVNEQPCVFEQALLSRQVSCCLARKHNIAEREFVGCAERPARVRCQAVLQLLRRHAVFVLGNANTDGALPHAKAMKLQIGGLHGLAAAVNSATGGTAPLADVRRLVDAATECFGGLDSVPAQPLVRSMAAFEPRRRTRRGDV